MEKQINIAKGIHFPIDAVTQKMAFIGRTGSGKTYGATKMAEEFLTAGVQIVVLDPVGVWHGLRTKADGKGKGFAIPIFGGLHADVPINPQSGKLIADLIVDENLCAILDVSQFETDADKARFASDFAAQLFLRKKAKPSPVHLFMEEAQEFIPQNPQKGEEKMLHNFQRIWKLGRNFGIGGSIISQRPQEVNKKALNQTEVLFAFQITGPHERKAIVDWIQDKGLDKHSIEDDLAGLAVGQCFLWSPQWLKLLKKIAILPKQTFDASSTPTMGKAVATRTLAPVDINFLRTALSSAITDAKQNDPVELRKEITMLKKELAKKPTTHNVADAHLQQKYDAVLHDMHAEIKLKEVYKNELMQAVGSIGKLADQLRTATQLANEKYMFFCEQEEQRKNLTATPNVKIVYSKSPAPLPLSKVKAHTGLVKDENFGNNDKLPVGEKKILSACAQYDKGATRAQLTLLTQYKRSSRDAYIQRLREKQFIALVGDRLMITNSGMDALGNSFDPLPVGANLQAHLINTLPTGEAKLLELLCNAHPNGMSRDELSEKSSYKRSSRDAYLQRLSVREVIIINGSTIKASDDLF